MPRTYRQKRRAEQQEATRRRIVEAAVALHGEVGPAETTISAVAERAGVQRATVYKHFPEEQTLFAACTAHWQRAHPPPDPAEWEAIADPEARLRAALGDIYTFYRDTEPMLANTVRDLPRKPELGHALAPVFAYIEQVRAVLAEGWDAGMDRRLLLAAIGHAIDFGAWRSLVRQQGLSDDETVELMVRATIAQVPEHRALR